MLSFTVHPLLDPPVIRIYMIETKQHLKITSKILNKTLT